MLNLKKKWRIKMSEKNEQAIDVNKLLQNKLKGVSIADIENGIAKTISELVGEDYKCTIGDVKYTMFSGADFHIKIELSYNPEN
jgi:hypothetical protein